MEPRTAKQDKELQKLEEGREKQEEILQALRQGLSEATYPNFETFTAVLEKTSCQKSSWPQPISMP